MEDHKIAFIICTNDQQRMDECRNYIHFLKIPNGYSIEIIEITDAKSMTNGYNMAGERTDAKYKVYMHQDVFIINRFFLYDMLAVFATDAAIGMIGMVGYPRITSDGIMWHEARYGEPLYGSKHYSDADVASYRYAISDGIEDVALIDGLMMITAYDLAWEEEKLTDWDFYDAFQSLKYLANGYRVVTPIQAIPWVVHDDGVILSMWNYGRYSRMFIQKYGRFMGNHIREIRSKLKNEQAMREQFATALIDTECSKEERPVTFDDVMAVILSDQQLETGTLLEKCLVVNGGIPKEKIIQICMKDIDFRTGQVTLENGEEDYCSNLIGKAVQRYRKTEHLLLIDARYFPVADCIQELRKAVSTGVDAAMPQKVCFDESEEHTYRQVEQYVSQQGKTEEGVWEEELTSGCILFANRFLQKTGGFIPDAVMPEFMIKKYGRRGRQRGAKYAVIQDAYVMDTGIVTNWELLWNEKESKDSL